MDMCYDGALVMPSSYAVMDEEEMIYTEGGKHLSGSYCRKICLALGFSAGYSLMAVASGAAVITKLIKYAKRVGGVIGWVIGTVCGLITGAVGKVAYGIGYGAVSGQGVNISPSPAPWDFFVSVTF